MSVASDQVDKYRASLKWALPLGTAMGASSGAALALLNPWYALAVVPLALVGGAVAAYAVATDNPDQLGPGKMIVRGVWGGPIQRDGGVARSGARIVETQAWPKVGYGANNVRTLTVYWIKTEGELPAGTVTPESTYLLVKSISPWIGPRTTPLFKSNQAVSNGTDEGAPADWQSVDHTGLGPGHFFLRGEGALFYTNYKTGKATDPTLDPDARPMVMGPSDPLDPNSRLAVVNWANTPGSGLKPLVVDVNALTAAEKAERINRINQPKGLEIAYPR